jgi:UDP-hydrolysing UDP-N-acetyl-D-glucosamine 2-epimerase
MPQHVIDVVSTARADFSLLRPVADAIAADSRVGGRLVLTGSHYLHFETSGLKSRRAESALEVVEVPCEGIGVDLQSSAGALGQIMQGFGRLWSAKHPDVCVVLGDRFEVLPVVTTALLIGIAIVHLYGGEEDVGFCVDTQVRDAITKTAHLHFVMHEANAQRLRMMGEEAWRIKVAGNTSIDRPSVGPEHFKAYARERGWGEGPFIAACYLPPTVLPDLWRDELELLLENLERWSSPQGPYTVVWAGVNADPAGAEVRERLLRHCAEHSSHHFVDGLGSTRYPSLLETAVALVGNSSSGLLESATHHIPVVDIGVRQVGRLSAANVLHVPASADAIAGALETALADLSFREHVKTIANPFHLPGSAKRIVDEICQALDLPKRTFLVKRLLPDNPAEFGGLARIAE